MNDTPQLDAYQVRKANEKNCGSYISREVAMTILMEHGEFTNGQAEAVLAHAMRKERFGQVYYPEHYIRERAKTNAERGEINANEVQ